MKSGVLMTAALLVALVAATPCTAAPVEPGWQRAADSALFEVARPASVPGMELRAVRLRRGCLGQEVRAVYSGPMGDALYLDQGAPATCAEGSDYVRVGGFSIGGRRATLYRAYEGETLILIVPRGVAEIAMSSAAFGAEELLGIARGLERVAPRGPECRPARGGRRVNLDADPCPEALVQIRASVRSPAATVPGRRWAVVDRTAAGQSVRPFDPVAERLLAPRIADRNRDGRPEIYVEGIVGNGLVGGSLWEWTGRRTRALWQLNAREVARALPRGGVVNIGRVSFPRSRFQTYGIRDVAVVVASADCRACPPRAQAKVRYSWDGIRNRWLLAEPA